MPFAGGVAQPESFSTAARTRAARESGGRLVRRSANGSCFAATESSAVKLSMMNAVTELPTDRHDATGSLVCTGSDASWKLPKWYTLFWMPSVENGSPKEPDEKIDSAAPLIMSVSDRGNDDKNAPNQSPADSTIDCDKIHKRAPVILPSRTPPTAFAA